MVSQCTKFEVSRFTRMQKMGWFGAVRGTQGHGQCPLASTPPGMPGTHPPNFLVGGDVNGNIPQYYYVLSDIAEQY